MSPGSRWTSGSWPLSRSMSCSESGSKISTMERSLILSALGSDTADPPLNCRNGLPDLLLARLHYFNVWWAIMHLSDHRFTPLSYSPREPTPTPPWVIGDTRQQGSFSEEEEVEEQRERGQEPRAVLQ